MKSPERTVLSALKPAILALSGLALVSAAPPAQKPGEGVLCLGTFLYFVEKTGTQCRAGEDAEFQARIAGYTRRFDDYITRNSGGDPAVLAKFKEGQNLNSQDRTYLCGGAVAMSYDHFKGVKAEDMDKVVDEVLARDGLPTFGDCV